MVEKDFNIPSRNGGIGQNSQHLNGQTSSDVQPLTTFFYTKEEYIKSLIDTQQIRYHHLAKHDDQIHLKGCLVINNNVMSKLDWSDVIVDSAIVEKGLISCYKYLPKTRCGIKTELKTCNIDEYMQHQAIDAVKTNGIYLVKGIFRIPDIDVLPDFSSVVADKVYCYKKGKIDLLKLPTAHQGFYGISPENLECHQKNAFKIARKKGFSKQQIPFSPENPFKKFFQNWLSPTKSHG